MKLRSIGIALGIVGLSAVVTAIITLGAVLLFVPGLEWIGWTILAATLVGFVLAIAWAFN